MKTEKISKAMPFVEPEGYVDQLVKEATEKAIRQGKRPARRVTLHWVAGLAASVLLLIGVATWWIAGMKDDAQSLAQTQQQDPLGQLLNSISDEEAQQIEYYEIEEIYF